MKLILTLSIMIISCISYGCTRAASVPCGLNRFDRVSQEVASMLPPEQMLLVKNSLKRLPLNEASSVVYLVWYNYDWGTVDIVRLVANNKLLCGDRIDGARPDCTEWKSLFRLDEPEQRAAFMWLSQALRETGDTGTPSRILSSDSCWVVDAATGRWALLEHRLAIRNESTFELRATLDAAEEKLMATSEYASTVDATAIDKETLQRLAIEADSVISLAHNNEMHISSIAADNIRILCEWWELIGIQRRLRSSVDFPRAR